MNNSVITVIGKDRVGIVYDVTEESKKLALDIRMQNEEIFQAMHRI